MCSPLYRKIVIKFGKKKRKKTDSSDELSDDDRPTRRSSKDDDSVSSGFDLFLIQLMTPLCLYKHLTIKVFVRDHFWNSSTKHAYCCWSSFKLYNAVVLPAAYVQYVQYKSERDYDDCCTLK